jgi:hypothetical protein
MYMRVGSQQKPLKAPYDGPYQMVALPDGPHCFQPGVSCRSRLYRQPSKEASRSCDPACDFMTPQNGGGGGGGAWNLHFFRWPQ